MKYKCYKKYETDPNKGGDYWRDFDFSEHLKLTEYQTTYKKLIQDYPPPRKILEAGCGIGRWIIPLSDKGYNVTGIEIEKAALEVISQNYSNEKLSLVHGDIFNMPFKNNSFDIILSLGVLEHFEQNEVQKSAILEHIRVLKDNGILIITVPYVSLLRLIIHVPYVKLLSGIRRLRGEKQYFSEYRYSRNGFKRIIKSTGLQVSEYFYDEFSGPYDFGLTVDYPIKRFFKNGTSPFLLNKSGLFIKKVIWKRFKWFSSGGIGFICYKVKS